MNLYFLKNTLKRFIFSQGNEELYLKNRLKPLKKQLSSIFLPPNIVFINLDYTKYAKTSIY
jgi:hypothetical protein